MSQGVVQCFLSCTDISQVNFHYSCYTGSMEILTTNPFQKMLCDERGGGGGGGVQAKMSQNCGGPPHAYMLSASLA